MNEGASGGQVISSHLYLNLLMHLVEKILLPQPLTLGGGDYHMPWLCNSRVCRKGGRRCEIADRDAKLMSDLQRLAEPSTMGDPMRPLKWVSKGPAKLGAALCETGHAVSANTVARLLETRLEYSRQVNHKTRDGTNHPDRDAQFEHINARVVAVQALGQRVVSVDTKKKELIGNYRNGGSDYRPKGDPTCVNVHDFPDKELGKVVPNGVYDVGTTTGWLSVGVTADTAAFAVNSIRAWRQRMGMQRRPDMYELTITADCGGSNGARIRLWKVELQRFADETGLVLHIHHYPPGTSK
jgi:hypothetical protein